MIMIIVGTNCIVVHEKISHVRVLHYRHFGETCRESDERPFLGE